MQNPATPQTSVHRTANSPSPRSNHKLPLSPMLPSRGPHQNSLLTPPLPTPTSATKFFWSSLLTVILLAPSLHLGCHSWLLTAHTLLQDTQLALNSLSSLQFHLFLTYFHRKDAGKLTTKLEFDPLILPLFELFPSFSLDKGQTPQYNRQCSDGLAAASLTKLISATTLLSPQLSSQTGPSAGLQTTRFLCLGSSSWDISTHPWGTAQASGPGS